MKKSDFMLQENRVEITVQGWVKEDLIQQITEQHTLSSKQGWFFIDYAITDVPLNTKFDVILKGPSKQLIAGPGLKPNIFNIEVISCLDQFGNNLDVIPHGHKTICKLEFHPELPISFSNLPTVSQWKYNPSALTIARHEQIEVIDFEPILDLFSEIFIIELKKQFSPKVRNRIPIVDFSSFIIDTYHINQSVVYVILKTLQQHGKISMKNAEEVELIEMAG